MQARQFGVITRDPRASKPIALRIDIGIVDKAARLPSLPCQHCAYVGYRTDEHSTTVSPDSLGVARVAFGSVLVSRNRSIGWRFLTKYADPTDVSATTEVLATLIGRLAPVSLTDGYANDVESHSAAGEHWAARMQWRKLRLAGDRIDSRPNVY